MTPFIVGIVIGAIFGFIGGMVLHERMAEGAGK